MAEPVLDMDGPSQAKLNPNAHEQGHILVDNSG